ncbi:unnamed protein product, partial [marine sediment metagenome]
ADNLIWMNRVVILIEVKTRTEGSTTIQNWARSRIEEGVEQIITNYERIKNNEIINLHNEYYNVQLDCKEVSRIIGIIVLVPDEELNILPSECMGEIYNSPLPIHVFTINDLYKLGKEIDTIIDLEWYLQDRYNFINEFNDIPTDCELEPIGYYKANEYQLPRIKTDFCNSNFWDKYTRNFSEQIRARNRENEASGWIDNLESVFIEQRRLHLNIPLGLYFAWELGSLPKRFRTIIGQKIETVQAWFQQGNTSRKFAYRNEE